MRVYILTEWWSYEGSSSPLGAYATLDEAKAACNALRQRKWQPDGYAVTALEVGAPVDLDHVENVEIG